MKFGCAICIFLNSENLICRSTDISKCSEGPFNFEITRLDCICIFNAVGSGNMFCSLLFKVGRTGCKCIGSCISGDGVCMCVWCVGGGGGGGRWRRDRGGSNHSIF